MRKFVISLIMLIGLIASLSSLETEIDLKDGTLVTSLNPARYSDSNLRQLSRNSGLPQDNDMYLVSESYTVDVWYDDLEIHYIFTSEITQKYLLSEISKGTYTKSEFLNDVRVIPWFGWGNKPSKGIYYLYADYMFK